LNIQEEMLNIQESFWNIYAKMRANKSRPTYE